MRPPPQPPLSFADDSPTVSFASQLAASPTPPPTPRFLPGTRFGDRYRIVELLGRGATGEVYRADDLHLGLPVALKFLPPHLADNPDAISRVRNEVRVARQVTHPNVCRVFDIGEVDGHSFISMEYVDGEDLRSVLRRLGRPSREKALEIARQLCAGLAAAHEIGVLHRDLKSANVMIDGRGRARIADFGLASFAHELPDRAFAGTPAYMAPELFAGAPPSTRTDIYALGAVLYELFTGRAAFAAETIGELRERQLSPPPPPSQFVAGLDPAVENLILACLDPDPSTRPPSALALATVLPGGDPLAVALAAGETPSPETVAAAGGEGLMPLPVACACLAAIAVGLLAIAALNTRVSMVGLAPPGKPPVVLADRAREIIARTGHDAPRLEVAYGYMVYAQYLDHIAETDPQPDRWSRLQSRLPRPYGFWYRESPGQIVPVRPASEIRFRDPPIDLRGMAGVVTDDDGRLQILEIVPPQRDASPPASESADYAPLFAAAGLKLEQFTAAAPEWNPPFATDSRSAWVGRYPDQPDWPIRVEAGAWRGKPVYFQVLEAFDRPGHELTAEPPSPLALLAKWSTVLLLSALLVVPPLVARRNLRRGIGDRRGAWRLGGTVFVLSLVSWALRTDVLAKLDHSETLLSVQLGLALLTGLVSALIYLALEPFVRRFWPRTLISWTRLLMGRVGDPRVGRDVLLGAVAGVLVIVIQRLEWLVPTWLGAVSRVPYGVSDATLYGGRKAFALLVAPQFLAGPLVILFVLTVAMLLVRRRWPAIVLAAMFLMASDAHYVMDTGQGIALASAGVEILLVWTVILATLLRLGLLALASAFLFFNILQTWPLTLDTAAWYSGTSLTAVLVLALIAMAAMAVARGGVARWRRSALAVW